MKSVPKIASPVSNRSLLHISPMVHSVLMTVNGALQTIETLHHGHDHLTAYIFERFRGPLRIMHLPQHLRPLYLH